MRKSYLILAGLVPAFSYAAPDWANNPETLPGTYSGVGVGESIAVAKQDAMRQIANSVTATVTSAISQTIETKNGKGSNSSRSYAQVVSDSVILPEIKWKNVASDDGIYYAQGFVSKSELIALYEQHIDAKLKNYDYLNHKPSLDLADYLKVYEHRTELESLAIQAATVSPSSFTAKQQYNDIMRLFDKRNVFKESLCFFVNKGQGTGYEKKILRPAIEEAIHMSQLKVKDSPDCQPVYFNSNSRTNRDNGKRYENIVLQLDIGKPAISSKVFKFTGESTGSKKEALVDAANKFTGYFSADRSLFGTVLDSSEPMLVIK